MDISSGFTFLSINLKRNLLPHFVIALVIVLLTPVVFGIAALDDIHAAQPIEMLLSLTGTVLLTPIFLPEQNENIRDVIRSKRMNYLCICMIRVICSVIALFMIIGGFVMVMHLCESDVTFHHLTGGFASALFLGALGFLAAGVTDNVPVGYMVSLIYYIANFAWKDKLGKLFLFSMSAGSFEEKYWLMAMAVIMIAAAFAYLKVYKLRV